MLQLRVFYGKICCVAYSLKVFAVIGGSILMIAASSRMVTATAGLSVAAFSCGGARSSKQATRSEFQVLFCPCVRVLGDMLGSHARITQSLHHVSGMQ